MSKRDYKAIRRDLLTVGGRTLAFTREEPERAGRRVGDSIARSPWTSNATRRCRARRRTAIEYAALVKEISDDATTR